MACASGGRKWVTVLPVVVTGIYWDAPVLVHLFDEVTSDSGLTKIGDSIPDFLGSDSSATVGQEQPHSPPERPHLSGRELEVLRLVAEGQETLNIAEDLGISPHTVRNHIRNFRNKLSAPTKLEAVLTAMRLGIVDPEEKSE